jgi:Family of unknown function (DUF5565)
MKKIISLFERNYDGDRCVIDKVVDGAEWVINGEGVATQKFDGTCCLVRDGKLYKRYEVKKSKQTPVNFEPASEVDPNTGKQQGWVPIGDGNDDAWHREAFVEGIEDGTYELCGPKVQGNPEGYAWHVLIKHGSTVIEDEPVRTFGAIRDWLLNRSIEGIVWHHPDGRMVKIKKKDFRKE